MRVEFTNIPPHDFLLITAENEEESKELSLWDGCVLSAKYDHDIRKAHDTTSLLIVKEI